MTGFVGKDAHEQHAAAACRTSRTPKASRRITGDLRHTQPNKQTKEYDSRKFRLKRKITEPALSERIGHRSFCLSDCIAKLDPDQGFGRSRCGLDADATIGGNTMHKLALIGATVIGAVVLSASPISVKWSAERTMSVSQDKAVAEIGRPATPGSVAGVARRADRRAVRRCATGVTC